MNLVEKMIKENYENSKKLNEQNDKVYTDIVCYIRGSFMENTKQEEVISDILEMLLRAQSENKAIDDIIGKDYKQFCDSIIEASGSRKSRKSELSEFGGLVIYSFIFMLTLDFIISYLPMAIRKKEFIAQYNITVNTILVPLAILLAAYGIVKYIMKNSFKLSNKKFSKLTNFIFGAFAAAIFLAFGFVEYFAGKLILFKISTFIVIAVLVVFWIYKLIKSIDRKRAATN